MLKGRHIDIVLDNFVANNDVQADRPGYDPISSTLWRQREEYCARMIQTVWRRNFRPEPGDTALDPVLTAGLLQLPDPMALLSAMRQGNNGASSTYQVVYWLSLFSSILTSSLESKVSIDNRYI